MTQVQVEHLKRHQGVGWVSALRAPQIHALVEQEAVQLSLFDEQNLAEIVREDYPGEGLGACCNPMLAEERARKREECRVRAHLFVCLLAGYVEWHLRRALAPLLFHDETLDEARRTRDPVAPAKPTQRAREKEAHRRRIGPSQPRYPARGTHDALPQHLPGADRPYRSVLPAPHRAHPDPAARRRTHRSVPSAGNRLKLKIRTSINDLLYLCTGNFGLEVSAEASQHGWRPARYQQ